MVAKYKKKRLTEDMSSDTTVGFKFEGSERGRAKTEIRKELNDIKEEDQVNPKESDSCSFCEIPCGHEYCPFTKK